jgi:hypothetical protein
MPAGVLKSQRPKSIVKELPKLNHLSQTSENGSPAEYGRNEETISPAALEVIGEWILKHVAVASDKERRGAAARQVIRFVKDSERRHYNRHKDSRDGRGQKKK